AGTQKLERELEAKLPELERIRLDADTVERPGALAAALTRFASADRVVLVGTQMVSKGHHFPGVALAAVVDADTGLGLPDFRAEERTFQLLTQLAGRSGRDAPGRVLVQTFQPDSRAIVLAARHDVPRFRPGDAPSRPQRRRRRRPAGLLDRSRHPGPCPMRPRFRARQMTRPRQTRRKGTVPGSDPWTSHPARRSGARQMTRPRATCPAAG